MPHVFEPAPSGRAKCRGCGQAIALGELRFGERIPNPFAEGETTLWFHPLCAAYKRPGPVLEALGEGAAASLPDRDGPEGREALERIAREGLEHRRLPRIDGAERSPSGKASCRRCREPIARGTWRIRLVYFEEARFTPGGFVHLGCRQEHFGTGDVLDRVLRFSPGLPDEERAELALALAKDAGQEAAPRPERGAPGERQA